MKALRPICNKKDCLFGEFLLEAGSFAGPLAQEVQIGPAYMGVAVDHNLLKAR